MHLILLVIRSTGARDSPGGVFPIGFPIHDVIGDVLPGSTELGIVPDNAFKIVPLPQPPIEPLPAHFPHTPAIFHGGHRFERTNHVPQRRGAPCGCPPPCARPRHPTVCAPLVGALPRARAHVTQPYVPPLWVPSPPCARPRHPTVCAPLVGALPPVRAPTSPNRMCPPCGCPPPCALPLVCT